MVVDVDAPACAVQRVDGSPGVRCRAGSLQVVASRHPSNADGKIVRILAGEAFTETARDGTDDHLTGTFAATMAGADGTYEITGGEMDVELTPQ